MMDAADHNGSSPAQRRGRMWRSMRILRKFTVSDLVATAVVTPAVAYRYVKTLSDAGYIECSKPHKPGSAGKGRCEPPHDAKWMLVRDTGPYAPRGGKHRDPNLDPTRGGTHVSIPKDEYARALKCVRACAGMVDPEAEVADLKRRAKEPLS